MIPSNPQTWQVWLPIAVSVLSFVLAGIALGWNIYRDVVLKARVKVSFSVRSIVSMGQSIEEGDQQLVIAATNHGPGPVRITMIHGKVAPFWRRVLRKEKHFVVVAGDHPLNPSLPHRLEVGETLNLLLPYNSDCFLKDDAPTHIGVSDSYDRLHYAPRKHLRQARNQYREDFG